MVRVDDELVTKQILKLFHSEDNSQALFVQLCILCYAGLREHLMNATGLRTLHSSLLTLGRNVTERCYWCLYKGPDLVSCWFESCL